MGDFHAGWRPLPGSVILYYTVTEAQQVNTRYIPYMLSTTHPSEEQEYAPEHPNSASIHHPVAAE
jgi:hypothetical protein